MTRHHTGLRLLSMMGVVMLVSSIALFGWEVYGRVVHTPHLWGIFGLGVLGAYFVDAPGTSQFITLVLRIVPWGKPPAGIPERRVTVPVTGDHTVEIDVHPPEGKP